MFPEDECQIVTNRGFMFLSDIEAFKREEQAADLMFASYDPRSRKLIYVPASKFVIEPPQPRKMIEVTNERESARWSKVADAYGSTQSRVAYAKKQTAKAYETLQDVPRQPNFDKIHVSADQPDSESSGVSVMLTAESLVYATDGQTQVGGVGEGQISWDAKKNRGDDRDKFNVLNPPRNVRVEDILTGKPKACKFCAQAVGGSTCPKSRRRAARVATSCTSKG